MSWNYRPTGSPIQHTEQEFQRAYNEMHSTHRPGSHEWWNDLRAHMDQHRSADREPSMQTSAAIERVPDV